MKLLNLILIFFTFNTFSFPQNLELGKLESGEFSVHKYFNELYKLFNLDNLEIDTQKVFPLSEPNNNRYKVFGYMPYWFISRWNTVEYDLLYVITYHSAEIDSMGNIVDNHGWLTSSYVTNMINSAHQKGVRVTLSATLFSSSAISSLLSNLTYRNNLIQNLISQIQQKNSDGIDINFEGIPSNQRDNLTSFMRQLRDSLKSKNPSYILTCSPTDFDFRQGDWDLQQISEICDLTFLQCYGYAYSTSSQAGPVGRLQGWSSVNASSFINQVLLSGAIPSKLIYGMPHYGYDWPVNSPNKKTNTLGVGTVLYYPDAKSNAIEFGRLWDSESLNAWYRYITFDGIWHQAWYEDPESAFHKYQFIKSKDLAGVGIWALGMDNTNKDIWYVLKEFVQDTILNIPPEQPILLYVRKFNSYNSPSIQIMWTHLFPNKLKGFRLFLSKDSAYFTSQPILNEDYLKNDSTSVIISGLQENSIYYVKVVAVDSSGRVSLPSDVYSASTGDWQRYLVIDGFDRTTGSYSTPFHSFNEFYSSAIFSANRDCDGASNESIINGLIDISEYSGVFWFLGDESTANKTFNGSEQFIVMNYLKSGSKLFITGSEIAYELSTSSPAFLKNFLKAIYHLDNSGSLLVYSNNSIIRDLPSNINLGVIYPEDWPDAIKPTNGSASCLLYINQTIAGIYFNGFFPDGSIPSKLVFLSFALETTNNYTAKNILIEDVIKFFEGQTNILAEKSIIKDFHVFQNYPNPFNSITKINYYLTSNGFIKFEIFNILGQLIYEESMLQTEGFHDFVFDGKDLTSGVYLFNLNFKNRNRSIKILLIK